MKKVWCEIMKKVCHILNSLLPSGAETMLANSSEAWENYEKHILVTAPELGEYASVLQSKGYIIHQVYYEGFYKQHKYVRRFLKEVKPDVVHIHREAQEVYYALDARLCGIKSIVRTVHNVFAFSGMLRLRRIFTRWISRVLGVKYVAISESVIKNEKKTFNNKIKNLITNWYNNKTFRFVNIEEYKSKRLEKNISKDTFVITSVGNCTDVKNHNSILTALIFLKKNKPDLNIKYFHIGHGPNEKKEINYVKENGLSDIVSFLGFCEPFEYLAVTDVFIMPSKYEGVGISAMEAMVSGVPCILTDVVGLCDFKSLKNSDIYYTGLGQSEINKSILCLANKFEEHNLAHSLELSKAAQLKYDMNKSVSKYLQVYQDVR